MRISLRIARYLPHLSLAIIAAFLTMAVIRSRELAAQRAAIYILCAPAEADLLLEIEIRHPVGFFNKKEIYLKKVNGLPDDAFSGGSIGCGIGSDATQMILCGQTIDAKSAGPGHVRLRISAHCITHALGAEPGTPPLIYDELDGVVIVVPTFEPSVQHFGKFTIASKTERVNNQAMSRSGP